MANKQKAKVLKSLKSEKKNAAQTEAARELQTKEVIITQYDSKGNARVVIGPL
jgi:hypothetical protein